MKEIKLSQGLSTIVDDELFDELNKFKWYALKNGNRFYAVRNYCSNGKRKTTGMHKIIMNTPKGMNTDHIDGNGLNNQKSNLRVVTKRQNCQNRHEIKTSQYVGVSWHKNAKKWAAYIQINGIIKYLGCFTDEIEAHQTYIKALQEIDEVFIKHLKEKQ